MITFTNHLGKADLYPFTYIRDTAELFSGAFSNKERWSVAVQHFKLSHTELIPANWIPLYSFWNMAVQEGIMKAFQNKSSHVVIERNWDFIQQNESIIKADIELLKLYKRFQSIPPYVQITGSAYDVYIEEGAHVEHVILNTTGGPIYISKGSLLMDGACLRGPVFIGENAVIKMGATIYGGTSIGKQVIAGGEIKNSILNAFSNKAHDGYLGDSIIGEWCNIGASTTVSNVKNTASNVKVWNIDKGMYETAGKKCGTMMGDFSRTSINSTLNTGSVIGICSNLVPTTKFIPNYVPNFTWYQDDIQKYSIDKALIDIQNWMDFKGGQLDTELKHKLISLFNGQI